MAYSKKLNGHFVKSKRSLIYGIILILIGIGFLISSFNSDGFNTFNSSYSLILILIGIVGVAGSRGVQLFAKAYIKLDNDSLVIKIASSEKKILWKNIDSISFADKKIRVTPNDKNFMFTSLKPLEDEVIEEIIEEISKIAKLKNIKIKK